MAKKALTDKTVEDLLLPKGRHRIDYDVGNVRGFAVQTTYTGAKRFLLVYVAKANGRERRMVIGEYGKAPKLSVSAARKRAAQLRAMVDLGRDPWQEAKDQRAAAKAVQARSADTFGNLILAYCNALDRARKPSAAGVRREVRTNLERGAPKLWKMPASEVTLEDLAKPLHKLSRAKKYRQAEKTRSYIRAAYTMAAASRGNANTSDLFEAFAGLPNIARDLPTIDRPRLDDDQDTGKRALTQPELAAYWKRVKGIDDATGALLRFHLLTGAQRCAQLARLTDGSFAGDTITIMDSKGRRKKARRHTVPLLPEADKALDAMRTNDVAGPYLFTLDNGATGAGFHAVRRKVLEVADAMVEAEEVAEPFTPGELRITVETRLAAAGVSKDIRAQLQSHGLGGVQDKHYDQHHYLQEKREALETLRALCEAQSGEVIDFRDKSGKRRAG